jgi:hypothetical protein
MFCTNYIVTTQQQSLKRKKSLGFQLNLIKRQMKSKAILVFLIAILSVISATMLASALGSTYDPNGLGLTVETTVNGAEANNFVISEAVGSTIPIKVQITTPSNNQTLHNPTVEVRVRNSNIGVLADTLDLLPGRTYTKYLSLKLPSNIKEEVSKDFRFVVTVSSDEGDFQITYDPLTVQRENYNLEILSAEVPDSTSAGSTMNVDVVVKNTGSHEAEDTFVVVRIPALGIQKKVYLSDLTPTDKCNDCDKEDSAEGIVSLKIPSDAKAGTYDVEVEAYNSDSNTQVTKKTVISGLEQGSDVLAAVTSKDIASGSTVTYDLILINSGNRIAVYNIVPESTQNLVISVDEPVVTVPADSSRVVKVNVQAGNVMGTFNFAVDVNSQGQLVKRVNLVANVTKSGITANSNVIVLTVVLAIIFIVLLVVLIVLLTRKPVKSEEFEESYY